jgi:hypothetical protein
MGEDGMSTLREAAQQALEAMEGELPDWRTPAQAKAITALRDALAQEEQEPVAWMTHGDNTLPLFHKTLAAALVWGACPTPLYPHPSRREWQSLSEEEINELSHTMVKGHKSVNWLARAIEAKLKEKNNG